MGGGGGRGGGRGRGIRGGRGRGRGHRQLLAVCAGGEVVEGVQALRLPEGQLRLEALREDVAAVEPALLCPASHGGFQQPF